MELEVSKKVREAIKAKLTELGCHMDDELPDYIMILVANRRTSQEIETDLSLFLGENTKKFVLWLTVVLKKLEQVTTGKDGDGGDKKLKRKHSHDKKKEEDEERDDEPRMKKKLQRNDPVKAPPVLNVREEGRAKKVENYERKMEKTDASHDDPDTLILDSGENEFPENVEELRRIALESQQKTKKDGNKIKDKIKEDVQKTPGQHQRKLITSILMDRSREDSSSPAQKKSETRKEHVDRDRNASRNERVLRTPRGQDKKESSDKPSSQGSSKSSVFYRVGGRRRSRSPISTRRSRSNSPARKLSSKIGHVIQRQDSSEEDSPVRSMSSVVKVTERPKRDLQLTNKMLLRAVADAQQSIIQTEQSAARILKKLEGKERKEQDKKGISTPRYDATKTPDQGKTPDQYKTPSSSKRWSDGTPNGKASEGSVAKDVPSEDEFPEIVRPDPYDPSEFLSDVPLLLAPPRRSVKERLGYCRPQEPRRSVKERLGKAPPRAATQGSNMYENLYMYETDPFSPEFRRLYSAGQDYKSRFSSEPNNDDGNGVQRNIVIDESKRISILISNSDSSDDSFSSPESPRYSSPSKTPKARDLANEEKGWGSDGEIQLGISEEDKLPELPPHQSDQSEYEYEEIVEEVSTDDANSASGGEGSFKKTPSATQQPINTVAQATHGTPSPGGRSSMLPDLRTIMSSPRPVLHAIPSQPAPLLVLSPNGTSILKCKFWPQCQFKDKCNYEHPKCKFSPCRNKDCVYKHDEPPINKSPKPTKVICRFYPQCTSMNCKYHHPSPCRFGLGCTSPRCENYHPGITVGLQKLQAKGVKILPSANQLKWVKKE